MTTVPIGALWTPTQTTLKPTCLIFRLRGGAADPAIGDTTCIAPPLSTPTESLDRIADILRASITAATR